MKTYIKKATGYATRPAAQYKKLNVHYIKSAINPRDFYSHELSNAPFKKHDWNKGGLCPFHSDNKPGSFHVNLTTGAYKCFSCGIAGGGDIIAFTMAVYGLDFVNALKKLADEWGLAW